MHSEAFHGVPRASHASEVLKQFSTGKKQIAYQKLAARADFNGTISIRMPLSSVVMLQPRAAAWFLIWTMA